LTKFDDNWISWFQLTVFFHIPYFKTHKKSSDIQWWTFNFFLTIFWDILNECPK
jgi:hypothetical protein